MGLQSWHNHVSQQCLNSFKPTFLNHAWIPSSLCTVYRCELVYSNPLHGSIYSVPLSDTSDSFLPIAVGPKLLKVLFILHNSQWKHIPVISANEIKDFPAGCCFTVNVGIVLPPVVDVGMQPNKVAGKVTPDQLLRQSDQI